MWDGSGVQIQSNQICFNTQVFQRVIREDNTKNKFILTGLVYISKLLNKHSSALSETHFFLLPSYYLKPSDAFERSKRSIILTDKLVPCLTVNGFGPLINCDEWELIHNPLCSWPCVLSVVLDTKAAADAGSLLFLQQREANYCPLLTRRAHWESSEARKMYFDCTFPKSKI